MNVLRPILYLILALTLPGVLSYVVVSKVFFPPVAYIIDGPREGEVVESDTAPSLLMPADTAGGDTAPRGRGETGSTPGAATRPPGASPGGAVAGQRPSGNAMAGMTLARLFTGIGALEREGKNTLSVAQAKSILSLMQPLRKQQKLTTAQAENMQKKLEQLLTSAQREEIAQLTPMRGPGGGGRSGGERTGDGAGGARPGGGASGTDSGGPPPAGGGRPAMEGMADMNPFNPDSDNPMAMRMAERIDEVFELLENKVR